MAEDEHKELLKAAGEAQAIKLGIKDYEDLETEPTVRELLDEAKRDFALRKWNNAADGYGQILEAVSKDYPDDAPLLAPLHHRYGHALLEHAISTSGALGGGGGGKDAPMPTRAGGASTVAAARAQQKDAKADQKAGKALAQAIQNTSSGSSSSSSAAPATSGSRPASKANDPRFTFGGDAEEEEEEEEEEPEGEAGGAYDEDDLGVAFTVLELARVRYEKILEGTQPTLKTFDGEEWDESTLKLQLAEVLNDLADVGLESENFQQASSDYELALKHLEPLLWPHSRRLADANLRLGLALEFHPDAAKQKNAELFVSSALRILRQRLARLDRRQQEIDAASNSTKDNEDVKPSSDSHGYAEKDDIASMDWQAITKERRDIEEMVKELELKVEEYAALHAHAANGSGSAASLGEDPKAALKQAINEALLGASTNGMASGASGEAKDGEVSTGFSAVKPGAPVNDLSAMVKKKKRPAIEEQAAILDNGKGKEKVGGSVTGEKRARVEDEASEDAV